MHNIQGIDKLYHCYQKALDIINRNQHMEKALIAYKEVQNLLKRRNIQILLITKASVSPTSISFSQSKIQKNRSQTLFKPDSAISRFTVDNQQTIMSNGANERNRYEKFQQLNGLQNIQQENINKQDLKTKSMNRIKVRRPDQDTKSNILNFIKVQRLGKLKSSSKASQKYLKKINRHVDRYEKNFQGAFDGKYDIHNLIDKKKTIFQNIYSIYDNLFAKNIPNHKIISKFMFNTTKINQILYNAYEKKKKNIKKDKQKTTQTKQKDKKQIKQKQYNEQKQKLVTKLTKNGRKLHSLKDATSQHTNLRVIKQLQKQKPYSQTTAITLNINRPQQNLMSNFINMNEYKQKQKNKQKKIVRSKTAKVKLNSQGNIQVISGQTKHMVSNHQKDHKERASKHNIVA